MLAEIDNPPVKKAAEISQLTITSSYKGVMLSQPVQVLSIAPGRVIVQAPDPTLCFTLKDRIELYNQASWETFYARFLALDMFRGELKLSDFTRASWHWNERRSDRVQPRDTIYVVVKHEKAPVRATLYNLSAEGMSLMIFNSRKKVRPIDQGSAVRLALQLPGDDVRLELKGKVIQEREVGSVNIIGIQLTASHAQKKRINAYVTARKAEIMAELERALQQESFRQRWMPALDY